MNANYNLLTVCQTCHDKIDSGEINVEGFMHTTNGKKLKFTQGIKNQKRNFSK